MLLGILHTDLTSVAWAMGLRGLQIPGRVLCPAGMPYDMSRNSVCQAALQNGFEYCAFLDSDVIPPPDAFLRLRAHRQPIISGVYCRRSPPMSVPVMIKDGQWVTQYPKDAIIEVDLVGAGCLLLHRSVLEDFFRKPMDAHRGKSVFDWRVDQMGVLPKGEALSEDFAFNLEARRRGYKILVDTSIQCRHVGLGQSTLGKFEACEVVT